MLSVVYVQKCHDRNVSRPKSHVPLRNIDIFLTQIRNPVRCCTIPGQNESHNNDG